MGEKYKDLPPDPESLLKCFGDAMVPFLWRDMTPPSTPDPSALSFLIDDRPHARMISAWDALQFRLEAPMKLGGLGLTSPLVTAAAGFSSAYTNFINMLRCRAGTWSFPDKTDFVANLERSYLGEGFLRSAQTLQGPPETPPDQILGVRKEDREGLGVPWTTSTCTNVLWPLVEDKQGEPLVPAETLATRNILQGHTERVYKQSKNCDHHHLDRKSVV